MSDPAADVGESQKTGSSWNSPQGHEHSWESFWGEHISYVVAGAGKCHFVILPPSLCKPETCAQLAQVALLVTQAQTRNLGFGYYH